MNHPRYTKEQKSANAGRVQGRFVRLDNATRSVRKNTIYHWTPFFKNGRRLELYPTMIGLHNVGRKLRYYNLDGLFDEIERFAKLKPEIKEDVELFET